MESASLEPVRERGAGRDAMRSVGGVLVELAPSKRAAIDAVFEERNVCCVEVETCRVGELGASGAMAVPRVFSHAGGFTEALLDVAFRRGVCEGVVGNGFRGELDGVVGRTVEGECARGESGRRKGEVRGLLKESGEGL